MKAYIVRTEKKIEPFGDFACDCFIAGKTLSNLQRGCLDKLGIEPVPVLGITEVAKLDDSPECIVFGDNLYFTPELLAEFLARSREQGQSTVCALEKSLTTQRTVIDVQDVVACSSFVEYGLRYLALRSKDAFCLGLAVPIVIDPEQFYASISMPAHVCGNDDYQIPLTDKFVIQIDHWANLWAANLIAILARGVKLQRMSSIRKLVYAIGAGSLNVWKNLSHFNKIGRGCDIHPTAYLEGSEIGDCVRIGAGAIIRESVIGSGVFVGNGVTVEESIVGEKGNIMHGHILYSVLYPGVFSVAQMISASLIGRDSFVGSGVTLTDFRLDGKNIVVLKDGVKVDTQNKFLGCCLGHKVYLGSGCIVAPGRAISSGVRITVGADRIINDCNGDQNLPGFRLV